MRRKVIHPFYHKRSKRSAIAASGVGDESNLPRLDEKLFLDTLTTQMGMMARYYINIEPDYRSDDRAEPALYYVRRSLAVILKNTSKFPALLADTLQAGAHGVRSVNSRTTELRKHRDHARTMAIQTAGEKAIALARELGQKVGKPRSVITER